MIRRLIVGDAIEYPNKPRLVLATELKDKIERMDEISPSEETLIKMISDARNKEPNPLDTAWHLGTLNEYPLSAEAIHYILKIQIWTSSKHIHPVTIREAKWISRLYSVIENNKSRWLKPLEKSLWKVSFIYASYEMICALSKTDFDIHNLDEYLLQGNRQFTLKMIDNPALKNAIQAARYQHKGLGAAKHYLRFLENITEDGET